MLAAVSERRHKLTRQSLQTYVTRRQDLEMIYSFVSSYRESARWQSLFVCLGGAAGRDTERERFSAATK